MCRKILSLCLAFCLFLAIAPAAFAQEPSISDRKGTAPGPTGWIPSLTPPPMPGKTRLSRCTLSASA